MANSCQSPLILVIDALDECDGDNDVKGILELFAATRGASRAATATGRAGAATGTTNALRKQSRSGSMNDSETNLQHLTSFWKPVTSTFPSHWLSKPTGHSAPVAALLKPNNRHYPQKLRQWTHFPTRKRVFSTGFMTSFTRPLSLLSDCSAP
jgi:hypothetical protein